MSIGLIPSTTTILLDLPTITDGSTFKDFFYTAHENGFYQIEFQSKDFDGSYTDCRLENTTRNFYSRSTIDGMYTTFATKVECLKGDSIHVYFQKHVSVVVFRFIYAIGSEPKE